MRAPPLCLALAVLASPSSPRAGEAGRVASDQGQVEILPGDVPVGRTIHTPEGWYRVDGPEEPGPPGTFSVIRSDERPQPPPAQPGVGEAEGRPPAPPAVPPPAPPQLTRRPRGMGLCEPERAAFLKELFHIAGVEVEDPLALVAAFTGEGAGDVPSLRFPEWGLVPVDPVRALAWDFELQIRARELSQCVRDPSRPRIDPRFRPGAPTAPSSRPAAPPAADPGAVVAREP